MSAKYDYDTCSIESYDVDLGSVAGIWAVKRVVYRRGRLFLFLCIGISHKTFEMITEDAVVELEDEGMIAATNVAMEERLFLSISRFVPTWFRAPMADFGQPRRRYGT